MPTERMSRHHTASGWTTASPDANTARGVIELRVRVQQAFRERYAQISVYIFDALAAGIFCFAAKIIDIRLDGIRTVY